MIATPSQLKKLRDFAILHGGSIEDVPQKEFHELDTGYHKPWSPCPFDVGIAVNWAEKRLVYTVSPLRRQGRPPSISTFIHELGHIFASKKPPSQAQEIEWLGWEKAWVKKLGLTWKQWANHDYGIYWDYTFKGKDVQYDTLEDLAGKPGERKFWAEMRELALENGCIDAKGNPLSVR